MEIQIERLDSVSKMVRYAKEIIPSSEYFRIGEDFDLLYDLAQSYVPTNDAYFKAS